MGLLLTFEIVDDFDEKLAETGAVESLGLEIERHLDAGLLLLVRLANSGEEWMLKGFIHTDAEVWVKLEHPVEEVGSLRRGSRVLGGHVHALVWRETLQVADGFSIGDVGDVVIIRCAKDVEDDSELVITSHRETVGLDPSVAIGAQREARFAWEQRLTVKVSWRALLHHTEQLGEDATYRPHVDGLTIVLLEEDKLWGTIPTCHNMTGQLPLHVLTQIFGRLELAH